LKKKGEASHLFSLARLVLFNLTLNSLEGITGLLQNPSGGLNSDIPALAFGKVLNELIKAYPVYLAAGRKRTLL
jgi:hypothetical protein